MTSLAAVQQVIAEEKNAVIRRSDAEVASLTLGRVLSKTNTIHRCTVYELFDAKTDLFLLSCIAKDEGQGWLGYGLALAAATVGAGKSGRGGGRGVIFTTLRDLDQRAYEDISTSPLCASYLGSLLPQERWGGLTWSLFTADAPAPAADAPHCTIRFEPSFTASPVQFALSAPHMRCRSKMPVWNTELGSYVHNFGCRVKVSSHRNFVCTATQTIVNHAHGHKGQATIDHQHAVALRHGKVASNEYVLDFRDPLTPLVALAVFCAVHANKHLVNTGP